MTVVTLAFLRRTNFIVDTVLGHVCNHLHEVILKRVFLLPRSQNSAPWQGFFFNGYHAQAFLVHSKLSIYTKSTIHVAEAVEFIVVVVVAVIVAVAPIVVAVVVAVRRRYRCRY